MLSRLFLSYWQRKFLSRGIGVFVYHNLGRAPCDTHDPFLWVETTEFERQLRSFRTSGFSPGTLDDLMNFQPGKVVITFDDGCRNVLEHGLDPLRRQGFTAIQFLVSGSIGKRDQWDAHRGEEPVPLMNSSEVSEWLRAGQMIGSHSVTHPVLTKCDLQRAREELVHSKMALEDLFGVSVDHFCFPHGKWNHSVCSLAQEAGYRTASTVIHGVIQHSTNAYQIPRISALSPRRFVAKAMHRLIRRLRNRK